MKTLTLLINFFSILVLFFTATVDVQRVLYASRFRNFSIDSEIGDVRLINVTIVQEKLDHALSGTINITKDFRVRNVILVVYRCNFENSACENFMEWKFTDRELKSVLYMKNQTWTPMFNSVSPKLDPPLIKKNIYHAEKATLDAKAALVFYPDSSKYFWRVRTDIFDTGSIEIGNEDEEVPHQNQARGYYLP